VTWLKRGSSDGSAPRRGRWAVAGTSRQWAKGNSELDRHGEEERGKGGTSQVGRRREMGQMANGPVLKKGIKI
jgi:hypothetical protein